MRVHCSRQTFIFFYVNKTDMYKTNYGVLLHNLASDKKQVFNFKYFVPFLIDNSLLSIEKGL